MSDDEKNASEQAAAAANARAVEPYDEHTTAPQSPPLIEPPSPPPPAEKWQMPKPKFQQTSGYLPQGYLKDLEPPAAEPGTEEKAPEQVPLPAGPSPASDGAPALAIGPQPDILDQLPPPAFEAEEPAEPDAESNGIFPVVMMVIAILLFAAVFITAVWYFYLSPYFTPTGDLGSSGPDVHRSL
jgi:hypothetical protein